MTSKIKEELEKKIENLYGLDITCTICGKKRFITNPQKKICVYCNTFTKEEKKIKKTNSGVV